MLAWHSSFAACTPRCWHRPMRRAQSQQSVRPWGKWCERHIYQTVGIAAKCSAEKLGLFFQSPATIFVRTFTCTRREDPISNLGRGERSVWRTHRKCPPKLVGQCKRARWGQFEPPGRTHHEPTGWRTCDGLPVLSECTRIDSQRRTLVRGSLSVDGSRCCTRLWRLEPGSSGSDCQCVSNERTLDPALLRSPKRRGRISTTRLTSFWHWIVGDSERLASSGMGVRMTATLTTVIKQPLHRREKAAYLILSSSPMLTLEGSSALLTAH